MRAAAPGTKLRLTLAEPSGRAIERFATVPSPADETSATGTAVALCTKVLIPAVSIALGFAAAAIRPGDPTAWIMLAMLLGFTEAFQEKTSTGPAPDLSAIWTGIFLSLWPASTAWFGLRFPEPPAWDRKRPWIKFVFMTLATAFGMFYFGVQLVWLHDINAAQVFHPAEQRAYLLWLISTVIAVTGFFWALGAKIRRATPDSRRRLKILYAGAFVAFAPVCLVVLYGIGTGQQPFQNVPWPVTAAALLMVAVFPLTLAYVIVVERAMDLRFVIRRSLQYAVAKGGLYLVRVAVIVCGFYIISRSVGRSDLRPVAAFELTGLGVALVIMGRRRTAGLASQWIDRKFFREAYDAEQVLSELADEAGRFVEVGPLVRKVSARISATLHVPDIVILLREGGVFRTVYTTRPGERLDIPAESGIVKALEAGREPLQVWFDDPPRWIRSLSGRDLQTLDFMRTQLLLPVPGKDGLAGIMSLGPKLSETPYSATDIRLTRSIAAQMGVAVENSRLLEALAAEAARRERLNREIEIAREVQERLFPQTWPERPGLDCAGYCRPARGVGGDYYDFLELEGGRIGIAIGGIAAALLMASLQASLRGQAAAGIRNLASLISNVNRLVYEASPVNRYATFFYGEYEPSSRLLRFVNAGHNPPIILRGEETFRLEATGPVVGLLLGANTSRGASRWRRATSLSGSRTASAKRGTNAMRNGRSNG